MKFTTSMYSHRIINLMQWGGFSMLVTITKIMEYKPLQVNN